MALPKTLGAAADRLYRERTQRLALEQEVKKLKAKEAELADHIQALLKQQRCEKATGKLCTVSFSNRPVGTVLDWPAIVRYADRYDAHDLIERRVAGKVLEERTRDGEKIPGVRLEHVSRINITKSTR